MQSNHAPVRAPTRIVRARCINELFQCSRTTPAVVPLTLHPEPICLDASLLVLPSPCGVRSAHRSLRTRSHFVELTGPWATLAARPKGSTSLGQRAGLAQRKTVGDIQQASGEVWYAHVVIFAKPTLNIALSGPILYFEAFRQPIVVLGSPDVVLEYLDRRSANTSDRLGAPSISL